MSEQTTLAALANKFDAFLVDQFGVLLDGSEAYPGAPEALAELARRRKRIVILSNSGKRSSANAARLVAKGFDRTSFEIVMSSGEAAHAALSGRIGTQIAPGAPVMILSRDDDLSPIEGLDLRMTDRPEDARLVIIAGSRGEEMSLEHYAGMLRVPASAGVACLCTNPDMTMLTARGPAFGAGRIAGLYEELGGTVEYVGKPHPLIYEMAAQALGDISPDRTVCIGDSPAHDVRGGRTAGYKTVLVRTGIHADEALEDVLADSPASDRPDFILPAFAL